MPYVISKACTNCGACLTKCPTQSITVGALQHVIDADTCDDFAACVTVCPVNAISKAPSRLESFRRVQKESAAKAPKTKGSNTTASQTKAPATGDEHVISGSVEAILKEYEK